MFICSLRKASVPETTHYEAELGQLPILPCLAHYANCTLGLYRLSRTLLCVETILGVMGLLLAPHITMFSICRWNAFVPCPYANMVKGGLPGFEMPGEDNHYLLGLLGAKIYRRSKIGLHKCIFWAIHGLLGVCISCFCELPQPPISVQWRVKYSVIRSISSATTSKDEL